MSISETLTGDAPILEAEPPGDAAEQAASPVRYPTAYGDRDRQPEEGMALCVSGGGYRAMLFHLGSLWRLNELRILPKLKRISSVSGGSITSAFLGLQWDRLNWKDGAAADFEEKVVGPIRRVAGKTIDTKSMWKGFWKRRESISEQVEAAYRKYLFGDATLQNLPDDQTGAPRFVINATNVQTGSIWRFSRPYMADYRVGMVKEPKTPLAFAVAASSAFPPFLSPARLRLPPGLVQKEEGADLCVPPFTTDIYLTDGGVYDNLGLETAWKRYSMILVSDGGGQMDAQEVPKTDWVQHFYRVLNLIDNQVRSLRKRQVVGSFKLGARKGAYWRIRGRIDDYSAPDRLPCPYDRTSRLAMTPTRLTELDSTHQERLINWGYALCDAAVRSFVEPAKDPPLEFPYPHAAV